MLKCTQHLTAAVGAVLVVVSMAHAGWTGPSIVDHTHEVYSFDSSIAVDADGKVHVAWKDFAPHNVWIKYAHNRNGAWETETVYHSEDATLPYMVITPDQVLHLFYNQGGDPNRAVEVTKPATGGGWSAPAYVDEAEGCLFGTADVDATGGILITYFNVRFDPNHGENYCRYKPLGGAWQARQMVYSDSSNGWPVGNKVRAYGNTFYISFSNAQGIPWYRTWSNGTLGPLRQVYSSGYEPVVVVNPTNPNELAASFGYDWRTWVVTSNNGGATWGSPMDISTLSDGPPSVEGQGDVAFTADGELHYAWKRNGGSQSEMACWYRKRTAAGAWQPIVDLTPNNIGTQTGPGRHAFYVVGNDLHTTTTVNIYEDDFNDIYYQLHASPTPPDTQPPFAVTHLEATPLNGRVLLEWKNPADSQFGGIRIMHKTTGFPTGPTDGEHIANVTGGPTLERTYTHYTTNGVTHYYALYAYDSAGNYSSARTASALPALRSDFDKDGDVDLTDFGHLQTCFSGSGIDQSDPDCEDAWLDHDGTWTGDQDVDEDDLNILLPCLSGEGVYADPACDPV